MQKFLTNRFAFSVVLFFSQAAFAWNSSHGALAPCAGILWMHFNGAVLMAHGPSMPPDPWDGNLKVANGPSMPPDPWDGNLKVAHGPSMPPDPWDGNLIGA